MPARLLVVIGGLNRGGAETHLLNILPRLDRTRFTPEVFVLAERGEMAFEMERKGVSVSTPWIRMNGMRKFLPIRILRLASIALQLWLHLMKRRPQIIHFFLPESYLIGEPVSLLANIRCRVMSRRSLGNYQKIRPYFSRVEKILHKTVHVAVGNSRAVVQELIEEGMSPTRVQLIYNGVDFLPYDAHHDPMLLRARLNVPDEAVMLVIVANLIPYKGHEDLIRALAAVAENFIRPWRLMCVGRDDGIGMRLRALAEELGISSAIIFAGTRSDVPAVLKAADIGILASHEEGFSNAALEYMAARLPIVVTAVGGNVELVCEGETGYLVPPRHPIALGEAILKLANDPVLARNMGQRGRQRVEASYSLEYCIKDYERLYGNLLLGS
jgi:glycosyltransferase involved in cell wall biosynthesis